MEENSWTKNAIFSGLSEELLSEIKPFIYQSAFHPNETVMKEGGVGDFVFFLTEGELMVFKKELKLAQMLPGDIVGLMAVIDDKPRSATVKAGANGANGFGLKKEHLNAILNGKNSSLSSQILLNYLRYQQDHVRNTNELGLQEARAKLTEARKRVTSAHFFAQMVLGLIIFTFLLGFLSDMAKQVESTFISFGLLFAYAVWSFIYIKQSEFSLPSFGLTMANIKPALWIVTKTTTVFILLLFALKWILISFWAGTYGNKIINIQILKNEGWLYTSAVLMVYSFHAVFQEFIARSCIQGGLMQFITGKWAHWKSIILATLMFSSFHLMIDLKYGFLTIIPGILWGYQFYKQKNLLAVSLSHIVIGIVALFVLNLMG